MSEGGSMRSLSGKVLWFWVFLLICYPLLVWTTGWIRSKKRSGPWKDHEATAPVRCVKSLFNSMAVHWTACTSRVFIPFWGYMKKHKAAAHVFQHVGGPLDRLYIKGIYTFLGLHEETQSSCTCFPTCWRSIGPPVHQGYLYLFEATWRNTKQLHMFSNMLAVHWTAFRDGMMF